MDPTTDSSSAIVAKEAAEEEAIAISDREGKAVYHYKVGKTSSYFYAYICMGLSSGITGVTQLDLRDGLGVTMDELTMAQSMKSIGMMLGGIVGGIAIDRFLDHSDLLMSTACLIGAVAVFFKPFTQLLWVMGLLCFLEGISHVNMNIVGSPMTLMLWGDEGDSPMQLLHFGYGVGWALAPLLAMNFISTEEESGDNSTCSGENTTTACNLTSEEEYSESRIEIPYTITAILVLLAAILFCVLYIVPPPKALVLLSLPKSSWKDVCSPGTCAGGHAGFAVIFISMLTVFYFLVVAKDIPAGAFIFSYAVEGDLDFTTEEAAWLDFANKLCFVVARGIAVFLAMVVDVHPMIFTEVFVNALMAVGLATLGTQYKAGLWVFSCGFQLSGAPIWPSGYSWADRYIITYAVVFAVIEQGCGVAGFSFTWLTGYLYTYVSPESTIYLTAVGALGLCVVLVVAQIIASTHGSRSAEVLETQKGSDESVAHVENQAMECYEEVEGTYL